ncbi:Predicted acyltransferase [Chitinophaga niabensis]|uniref:Predicted acyltransferase n=2 Tax=Chitinophaga niabensis TaxID=536979 RepID=A0A1N6FEK5_9BACT|nr:Predicted acyltransferase [Chitinophaga niabensis]
MINTGGLPNTMPAGDVSSRLQSLDALRGFDMFWIISGEEIFTQLAKATHHPVLETMAVQLHHSEWNGFTFYDLIFPLFIFIAGVSMPFAYAKAAVVGKKKIYSSLVRRTLILIVLGMVVNGLLHWEGYENTRFASVLGRIGLSCFFAALIYLNCSLRMRIIWVGILLIGYWAAMMLIPVPGFGAGVLTPEGNFAGYFDRLFLPGHLYREVFDPEGLFSTVPAIGSALLGVLTGDFLKSCEWSRTKKGSYLALAGVVSLILGYAWGLIFPLNKHIWTSSFVLVTAGWSLLLLSFFYLVIDAAGWKKWSMPFVWIGTNAILIYMASHGIVNFKHTSQYLFGGLIKFTPEAFHEVWLWCGVLAIELAALYFLYRKRWFLKI